MAWLRGLLTVALVVTAVLLEITVLPWLHLPGAVPDIVAVTVAALGYAAGPVRGAAAGFLAGLLLDLVPPADGLLGLTAVVLVVVGYLAGVAGGIQDRPKPSPWDRGRNTWTAPPIRAMVTLALNT